MCYYFKYDSIIRPVSNFTELHALTLATRSYALLVIPSYRAYHIGYLCAIRFGLSRSCNSID